MNLIRRAYETLFLLLLLTCGHASGQSMPATLLRPHLCAPVVVVPDPSPPGTTGRALLEFCTDVDTPSVRVTIGDFVSRSTGLSLGTQAMFYGPGETQGKAVYVLPALKAGQTAVVRLEISHLTEAGESRAALRLNGVRTATIRAIKYHIPFNVTLETPNPDKRELNFLRDEPKNIVLKNGDPVTYFVDWAVSFSGHVEKGKEPLELPPNGSAPISVTPDPGLFVFGESFLKDAESEGQLSLAFHPPGQAPNPAWPHKVITFTAHLSWARTWLRDLAVSLFVLILLGIGAFFSIYGQVGLPNRRQRVRLLEVLNDLAHRSRAISRRVDSRTRVVVGVERNRSIEQLSSRLSFSGALTELLGQAQPEIDLLKRKVDLLERVDERQQQLARVAAGEHPPTELKISRDKIWTAAEIIGRTSPAAQDLEEAATLLEQAKTGLNAIEARPPEVPCENDVWKALVDRWNLVPKAANTFLGVDDTGLEEKYDECRRLYKTLYKQGEEEEKLQTNRAYARLDSLSSRLQMMAEFLDIYRAATAKYKSRLAGQWGRLMKWASLPSWEAHCQVQRIVQEAEESIFPSDVLAATPEIDCGQHRVDANQHINFRVRFADPRFQDCTALQDLQATWKFGDGMEERGWNVAHYYPWRRWWRRWSRKYAVSFNFQDPDSPPGNPNQKHVTPKVLQVQKDGFFGLSHDRNRVEIERVILAILPAAVALLASGKEQLLQGDILTGVVAVFLLGFGSDTVKNLVSKSQATGKLPSSPSGSGSDAGKKAVSKAQPKAHTHAKNDTRVKT